MSRPYRRKGYQQPFICRPRGPYIALVAEKPKAAEKIALALGRPQKCRYMGIPYWVLNRNGSRIFVVPSAGHLFGPHSTERGFPVYSYEWRPLYEFDKNAKYTERFYRLMSYVLPGARLYINACDYDIEGSVIGYTIIEEFGDVRRYKRMKFSSLSPVELRAAYERLEGPDTLLVEAGKARHEVDWLWGINVSRALMYAARKATGKRIILSAGRVQSPTIVEAARRWEEINLAVPIPAFTLQVALNYDGTEFNATPYEWKPETLPEANSIARQLRKEKSLLTLHFSSSKSTLRPPPAFNLGDLQKEASRLYGFSPMKTQSIAEDLYLEALISYPRTNSQKLPPTIDYSRIIRKLSQGLYAEQATRLLRETGGVLKPVQGPKDDPAHPAIHPTGELPRGPLDRDHQVIYDLIVRRFLAAFAQPVVVSRNRALFTDSEGRKYVSHGIMIEREGWFYYYPYLRPKEEVLPLLPKGSRPAIIRVSVKKSWQRKAPQLSRTSLLTWMESEKIGTEATRARIIETLFKRRYLESRGGQTAVTDLGMSIAEIIKSLFPDLSKPDLTRKLESLLEDIREGKRTRKSVVEETIKILDKLLNEYREKLEYVGDRIAVSLGVKEPLIKCSVCSREAVAEDPVPLCRFHYKAYQRLQASLPIVAEKLGISEDEALLRLSKLKGRAGKWIIDIALYLVSRGLSP